MSHVPGRPPLPLAASEPTTSVGRRSFVQLCAAAAASFLAACPGRGLSIGDGGSPSDGSPDTSPDASAMQLDYSNLPTLGGAPSTRQGHTIAAFIDTVVPGAHRDPLGKPGGIDFGAPAVFFDPTLPLAAVTPLLVSLLDSSARQLFSKIFAQLTPDQRDQALDSTVAMLPDMDALIELARFAVFSTDGAARWLGYPGANAGYRDDPDLSFGVALTTEITTDGNLP